MQVKLVRQEKKMRESWTFKGTSHANLARNKVLLKALLRDAGGHSSLNKVIAIDAAILFGVALGQG